MPLEDGQIELKYLLTRSHDDGEYSRHLDYLLRDGSRRRVTIDAASDSQEVRHRLGLALYAKHVERAT